MANNVKTPPKFGLNFSIWKVKMIVFLHSLGSRVAKAIIKPFVVPDGDKDTWTDITAKEFEAMPYCKHSMMKFL